jgi:uncharacterized protein (TIGR02145 family)
MAMKKMTACSLIMMVMLFLFTGGCNKKPILGEMTDARDGQTYKTVTLGDQTWFAQDLNYETDDSWCYEDNPVNCETYGRLYNWEEALTACPADWHLASDEEWSTLIKYLDPKADPNAGVMESEIAGGKLKATGTIEDGTGLWKAPNVGANNSSGFSGLPGGARFDDGTFLVMGLHAIYWTSTEYDANSVWFRILDYGLEGLYRDNSNITKTMGLSVRCVMD